MLIGFDKTLKEARLKKKSIPISIPVFKEVPVHASLSASVRDSHQELAGENYSAWDEDDSAPEWFRPAVAEIISGPEENTPPVELTVAALKQGERLDKWLAARLTETSRSRLQQWITHGHVHVNGAVATVRQTVWNDDVVVVQPQQSADQSAFQPEAIALDIVYEDATLLVINKPAGLVVHPAAGNWSGTLLNGLLHYAPQLSGVPRAGIVHRLDKDTSGLMVVAKTLNAQTHLVRQLQARTVKREYLALVHGHPPESGTVNAPMGRHPRDRIRMAAFKPSELIKSNAKPAVTHFQVLQRLEMKAERHGRGASAQLSVQHLALVCCKLETGRTHQIRVHMQSIGFALVGDPLYGRPGNAGSIAGILFTRQALHAWQLGLIHPESGERCMWQQALPADFAELLNSLGFDADHSLAGSNHG